MFSSTRAAFFGAIAGSAVLVGLGQALASEPANLGNFLPGNTMGAPIAAAPPPGLWFASGGHNVEPGAAKLDSKSMAPLDSD